MSTMKPLSLRVNFSWTLLSNILYGLYQWIMVAIVAKTAGPESVGQLALGLAIVTPVQMLFNLQLRALQASDASESHPFRHYLTLRVVSTALSVVVVILISFIWPLSREGQLAVWGILSIKALESLSDVVYGAFQHAERMDVSSRARMLESVGGVTCFSIVLLTGHSLFLALLSVAMSSVAIMALYTYPRLTVLKGGNSSELSLSCDIAALRALLMIALPLGITMGLLNLNAAMPRLALGYFDSEYEVGIFSAFMQLVVSGTIVVGALGQAVTPVLARYVVRAEFRKFKSLLTKLIGGAFGIGLLAALSAFLVGAPIVGWLYTPEFSEYRMALTMLALSSGLTFAASFQGYALTAARIIAPQVWMFVGVAVVTAISLATLVPIFGIEGATLSVLIGASAQFMLSSALLQWKLLNR